MAYNMSDVEVLFKKGKRTSAAFIQSECITRNSDHKMLSQICSHLFDVNKKISDWDTIDWIKWIISGGKTPEEFSQDGNH
jgi:E3 ubiquitin-protein ligase UBR3